jgi:hypothetical protein
MRARRLAFAALAALLLPLTGGGTGAALTGDTDRLSSDLTALLYSTYLGGNGADYGRSLTVDRQAMSWSSA